MLYFAWEGFLTCLQTEPERETAEPTVGGWQMSLLCIRTYSQIPELSSKPGNNGDSTEGYGIECILLTNKSLLHCKFSTE